MDIRIVVLNRGWVVVGKYERDGDEVIIRSASVIRRWGTTKGIGEIAAGGPTKDTKLDPAGEVRARAQGVVLTLAADPGKWANHVA